jgi:phospholipid/cholesterol/gamma-HCH transport system ATP-binding protein
MTVPVRSTRTPAVPFVCFRGLWKAFGAKQVLRGLSLDVYRGETLVILGGSGSGKSVLLKHINGLLRPDAGRVTVDGHDITALDEAALVPVRRKIGVLFQSGALFDSLTIGDNVAYGLREHTTLPAHTIASRVQAVLAMVDLPGTEDLVPAELSGGMRKRAALARAVILEPAAVLYDEPTTGLDPVVAHKIDLLIRQLQHDLQLTSVVVTHDLHSAFAVGDRFAFLHQGVIRFVGTREELQHTSDAAVAEFLAAAA